MLLSSQADGLCVAGLVSNKMITSGFQEGAIQEDKQHDSTFQDFACIILSQGPLASASHVVKSSVSVCLCVCLCVHTGVLCVCVCIGVQNGVNVGRNGPLRATKEQTDVVKDRCSFVVTNTDK